MTDCSELRYGVNNEQRVRLSAIKDLYDHRIVSWAIASTETAELVSKTLDLALQQVSGAKPKIVHSDQGSSYTSGSYNLKLASLGITHSMSRPGTPGDNSPMESFWSHMKEEFFAFEQAYSQEELALQISRCIDWYNNKRRQETLNGMTPTNMGAMPLRKVHKHFNYLSCLLDTE
ncbi:transposase [Agrilactobacillus fermenti]|uniref:transposase n=1 Tax=Agrilactobacillus fermenti TaxID=2586909 RepID=UPI003A5B98AA